MSEKYLIDSYHGLIYESSKADKVTKYQTDEFRYLRHNTRKVLAESDKTLIDSIYIHPVGYRCLGNCVYCMNESYVNEGFESLDVNRLNETLDYLISHNRLDDDVSISFSGGEPVLAQNIEDYILAALNKLGKLYSVTVCTGMFYSNKLLTDFLVKYASLSFNKRIEHLNLAFSVDIDNSMNRSSKSLKINNKLNFKRCLDILPSIIKDTNIYCSFNIRLNDDTNIDEMIKNIYKIFEIDNKIVIRLSIIDDDKHALYVSDVEDYFNKLKKHFNLSFTHKGSFTLELTSKESNIKYNNLMLLEIEDGIYCLHPLDQSCWTWSKYFGIGPTKYFACFFGFYESENIEDVLQITENNQYKNTYNTLSQTCLDCELLPFCKLCKSQRQLYGCDEVPALKEYMRQVFNIMIADPSTWFIE